MEHRRDEAIKAKRAVDSAWNIVPNLKSRNIKATAKFYTEELQFGLGRVQRSEMDNEAIFCSVFIGVDEGSVNIYHVKCEAYEFVPGWVSIAMETPQLEEYYEALVNVGVVEVIEEIDDRPWGHRVFTIKDGDGNKLTFFRLLEGPNYSSDLDNV